MKNCLKYPLIILLTLLFASCGSKTKKDDEGAEAQKSVTSPAPKPATPKTRKDGYESIRRARKAKDHRSVVSAAQKKLEKNPKDVKALNVLAMIYYQKKQFGLAKILLSRAFSESPRSAELHNNLGLVHLAEGELNEAIRSFRKALGIDANYAAAAANLGSIYVVNGDYRKAKVALASASKKYDLDYKVQHNYALALMKTGNYETAREHFQKSMELNNSDSTVLLNYAILLVEKLKDYKVGQDVLDKLRFAGISSQMRDRVGGLQRVIQSSKGSN